MIDSRVFQPVRPRRAMRRLLPVFVGAVGIAAAAAQETPRPSQSPLVRLQRLQEQRSHLHTDQVRYRESDSKLFLCSYSFGVIDARDPTRMTYLAEGLTHTIPGDNRRPGCINLAWDGNIVYTTHRGNIDNPAFLTGWDISKPDPAKPGKLAPVQLPVVQEPGVTYEGLDVAGGHVFVALRGNGLGVYERDASNHLRRIATATGLKDAVGVAASGRTVFVADSLGGLAVVDVTSPSAPTVVGRVATGGQARSVVVNGNIAYVGAGSSGLVVVDVTNRAAPKVVASVAMPGTAVRVAYSAGRVFVAAWNDARVYDVTSPLRPRFIGAVRFDEASGGDQVTARTLGVAGFGDVMFVGNWFVPYSYRVYPDRAAPSLVLPEGARQIDFGSVPAGTSKTVSVEILNQGTAPLTLTGSSIDVKSFTVEPASARIAPHTSASLSVTYRPTANMLEQGTLRIASDDPAEPVRTSRLFGNRPGLGIGDPMPEMRVQLLDGSEWSSAAHHGQVQFLAYFATF
jgi:hypothetical protein